MTDDMRGDEKKEKEEKEKGRVRENEKRGRFGKTSEKRGKLRGDKGKKVKKNMDLVTKKRGLTKSRKRKSK